MALGSQYTLENNIKKRKKLGALFQVVFPAVEAPPTPGATHSFLLLVAGPSLFVSSKCLSFIWCLNIGAPEVVGCFFLEILLFTGYT